MVDADVFAIGTSIDPHVGAVLDRLSPGLEICRFNVDEFPETHRLTVSTGGSEPRVCVDTPAGSWNVTSCPAAWFRRLGRPGISDQLSEAHRRFAGGEAEETLNGALSLVAERVLGNPKGRNQAAPVSDRPHAGDPHAGHPGLERSRSGARVSRHG
jgi:hypothetical protein